ncbi:glycosyltransferase [Paenibacillus sp. DXFW5]|uniref:Glycosyltransferase n=1 Tax=Paenibacillus rhizolycopersici TaxID=2780073 RepID=A0ABS2HCV8_9BACL|nr:glycosyltransferase [Paenibacillus rhizolycopersici]MBM6997373.1 glycosyltransferase [Paenibacillus rhizolycopersici]
MENVKENRYGEAYQVGYEEGIRYGGCQAVLERIPQVTRPKVDLRVLYVPQGFDAIDEGVQAALKELTRECVVASPEMMLQETLRVHPDLVLVMNSLHVFPPDHASQMAQIRSMGIRTAVWFVDDPYFTDDSIELALSYDVVFTHEIECVPLYRSIGVRSVYHLPLAANPHQFRPIPAKPEYRYDVCFIGNAFWNRVGLFDRLSSFLQDKRVLIAGFHWDRLPRYEQLSRFIRPGWVPVEETVRYYNASKIVLNIHRPTQAGQDNRNGRDTPGGSINPRTYEIAGCGAFQITDIRSDLVSYYQPGYDIETFRDEVELEAKIRYYLEHEEERRQIAWRSLWTTTAAHTYSDRVSRLLDAIAGS